MGEWSSSPKVKAISFAFRLGAAAPGHHGKRRQSAPGFLGDITGIASNSNFGTADFQVSDSQVSDSIGLCCFGQIFFRWASRQDTDPGVPVPPIRNRNSGIPRVRRPKKFPSPAFVLPLFTCTVRSHLHYGAHVAPGRIHRSHARDLRLGAALLLSGGCPGERGFQPLIAFCPEIGMVLHGEMRNGNVPASKGNLEALAAVLDGLPRSVERAMVRMDGAGYQERIIRFCNNPSVRPGPLRRFGTVALVAGAPRTKALMEEVDRLPEDAWRPLPADGEACRLGVAELGFVPNMGARQGASHLMRFVATRRELPGELGVDPGGIPAAAGILPSGRLGANAAWLKAAAVTLNVIALLRTVSMGGGWLRARMKRIRAVWIHHVGMVSRRGRRTTLVLPPAARHVSLALDRLARSQAPP